MHKSKKLIDAEPVAAIPSSAPPVAPDKPLTREQQMDLNAKRDFDHLDRVNQAAKAAAAKIMSEPAASWASIGGHAGPRAGVEAWRGYMGIDGPIARRRW